jgi:WD40 repeat protein
MLSSRFHFLIQYACAFCFYGNQVVEADLVLVSSLTLSVPTRASTKALMAVGKGSGCISAWEFDVSWCCTRIACQLKAHDQVVTGLTWGGDGRCLYSCGQDNHLKSWEFMGSELWGLPFPDCSALFVSETPQVSSDVSVLKSYQLRCSIQMFVALIGWIEC